jgi:hypothetical protein
MRDAAAPAGANKSRGSAPGGRRAPLCRVQPKGGRLAASGHCHQRSAGGASREWPRGGASRPAGAEAGEGLKFTCSHVLSPPVQTPAAAAARRCFTPLLLGLQRLRRCWAWSLCVAGARLPVHQGTSGRLWEFLPDRTWAEIWSGLRPDMVAGISGQTEKTDSNSLERYST